MPGPLQQTTGSSLSTSTMTMTAFGTPLTAGSIVVVCVEGLLTTNSRNAPSITGCGNWVKVCSSYVINNSEIWAGNVLSGGGTVCVVTAPVAHSYRGNATEWPSPYVLVGASGVGRNYASGAARQVSTNTLTPTALSACLLIAGGSLSSALLTEPSAADNYTALTTLNTVQGFRYREVASASGSYAASWTQTGTASFDNTHAVFYQGGAPALPPITAEALGLSSLTGLH